MSTSSATRTSEASALLGTRVAVTVAEPWGFARINGGNDLTGRVYDAGLDPASGRRWAAIVVEPFEPKEGGRAARLVATERHTTESGLFANLSRGEDVVANMRYSPGDASDPTDFGAGPLPFLVGSVRLA